MLIYICFMRFLKNRAENRGWMEGKKSCKFGQKIPVSPSGKNENGFFPEKPARSVNVYKQTLHLSDIWPSRHRPHAPFRQGGKPGNPAGEKGDRARRDTSVQVKPDKRNHTAPDIAICGIAPLPSPEPLKNRLPIFPTTVFPFLQEKKSRATIAPPQILPL